MNIVGTLREGGHFEAHLQTTCGAPRDRVYILVFVDAARSCHRGMAAQ